MPEFHAGLKAVQQEASPNCQAHPLDECHDEVACHAQGEKRNDIIRLLNCWIDSVEGECSVKKKKYQEPCEDYVLCYPEYSCAQRETVNSPFCIKGNAAASLLPEKAYFEEGHLWKRDSLPTPVWERPRVKSSQLIAGEFRKIKECFKSNGLDDDHCPRTESCQLMKSMNEMVEADRKLHGWDMLAMDCCCRPGDAPSRMPQFKCTHCEPSSQYGYKNMRCPAEIGSHREPYQSHQDRTQLPYQSHQDRTQLPYQSHQDRTQLPYQSHQDRTQLPYQTAKPEFSNGHQHGVNSRSHPPVHSYQPLNVMRCPAEIGCHREPCQSHQDRTQLPYQTAKPEFSNSHQHGVNSRSHPPVHSYQPLNVPSNRFEQCLMMNNPRSSGEIWEHDMDIFGHHAKF